MSRRTFLLLIVFIGILLGCEGSKKSVDQISGRNAKRSATVPSFNSDSAYLFIQKHVDFGPRVPNSIEHKLCGEYLSNILKSYGASVIEQDFSEQAYDGTTLYLKNIIASYNLSAKKRVLLAAHWDTRPFADKDSEGRYEPIDGANDGEVE